MTKGKCNDYEQILTHALNELKEKQGTSFDPQKINLAELERMTGISRSRLRRLKKNNCKQVKRKEQTDALVSFLNIYFKYLLISG
ncbi:MAG: hypothetical protein SOU04_08360 [Lachnospiraceae bacterium]|nr:hypothetical protein [Lachnospiraceae bacterium]